MMGVFDYAGRKNIWLGVASKGTTSLIYNGTPLEAGRNYRVYLHSYDVYGNQATVESMFAYISPIVRVTPTFGPQGTTFDQPGTGFTPNSTATLHFVRPGLGETTLPKGTDSFGAYANTWRCDACPVGQYQYWAVDTSGQTSNTVTFTVYAPQ